MKNIYLIACLLVLCGCGARVSYSNDVETALKSLDKVISNKEMIEGQKENRILRLRSAVSGASSERELYKIYDNLFDEYFQYNIDSTISYAHKKIALAKSLQDSQMMRR